MEEKIEVRATISEEDSGASKEDLELLGPDLKRLTRKIDWTVLPLLSLLYLLSFLDKSNIGNARLAGIEKDLCMKGLQYNGAVAILYPFYCLGKYMPLLADK
jgi:hypothetical protein